MNRIHEIAQSMIDADRHRNELFDDIDKMVHLEWDYPEGITASHAQYLHKVVSSDPQDSARSVARYLEGLTPVFKVPPLIIDNPNKEESDKIEAALAREFARLSARRSSSYISSLAWDISKYGGAAARVIDTEEETAAYKSLGYEQAIPLNAKRFGRFAIEVYNMKNVHWRESYRGIEAVLLVQKKEIASIISDWGTLAKGLRKHFDSEIESAYVFDYEEITKDGVKRTVWVSAFQGENSQNNNDVTTVSLNKGRAKNSAGSGIYEIMTEEPTGRKFFNWAIRVSGNLTESDPRHRFSPMLKPIAESGAWDTQNMAETLNMSSGINQFYGPKFIKEGYGDVQVYNDEPGNEVAEVPAGTKLSPINVPSSISESLLLMTQRVEERMQKSTIPRVFQTGDVGANTPAQAVAQLFDLAAGTIEPYVFCLEELLADVGWLILAFIREGGDNYSIEAVDGQGQVEIVPGAIALERPVNVELKPRKDSNYMQRANAMNMMLQAGVPKEEAYEIGGIQNPAAAIRKSTQEAIEDTVIQNMLKTLSAQGDAQAQQIMMAAQMQAQAQMQQQQMQQQQMQGMNPAMGGMSPVNEMNTREAVTGMNRDGSPAPSR